ncbi:MAG: hypothetical protein KKE05_05305 [Nanoarchaeota archaeon]|nr:hypothetical protein [Nanoarchaeota archaeon]
MRINTYYDLEKLKRKKFLKMDERKAVREKLETATKTMQLCKILLRKGIIPKEDV